MVHRKLESTIIEMLESFRIVAINGPRQSGKTTLQKKIATNKNMKYYTFDDSDIYNTASSDPKGFIEYISKTENIAIDEVQMIPEIIPPIKMYVDERNRKGMFLLTGSSDMFKNSKIKESLAGRMVSFNLYPLSYSEINKRDINIIDKLFSDDFNTFDIDFESISKEEFISAVINGGYPEVYNLPIKAKKAWYDFYIKARITKDIANIAKQYGASVPFLRPDVLASDTATSFDAIKHTIEFYKNEFDNLDKSFTREEIIDYWEKCNFWTKNNRYTIIDNRHKYLKEFYIPSPFDDKIILDKTKIKNFNYAVTKICNFIKC